MTTQPSSPLDAVLGPRRYAIIASDVNLNYAFYLPFVCEAWKALGFKPVLLLSEEHDWVDAPAQRFALKQCQGRADVIFVRGVDGFRTSTVMQTCRLLAAADKMFDDACYLVTTDVDMIPLSEELFAPANDAFAVHIYSADAYRPLNEGLPPKFPMCYLGANASTWREVMGIGDMDVSVATKKALAGRADSWNNDEDYFASRIFPLELTSSLKPVAPGSYAWGKVQLIERGGWQPMARQRLDRERWVWGDGKFLDCHGQRPGWMSGSKDDLLARLTLEYLPGAAAELLTYRELFRGLAQ